MTPYIITALTNTPVLVRQGPTYVDAYDYYNASSAAAFVQFFDAESVAHITLGTTAPKWSIGTATLTSIRNGGLHLFFAKGLVVAGTTTVNGSTTPTTTGVTINLALG